MGMFLPVSTWHQQVLLILRLGGGVVKIGKRSLIWLAAIVAGGVLLNWLLNNFSFIGGALGFLWGVLFPFVLGFIFAFVLNLPMHFLEKLLFRGRQGRLPRVVSFVLALVLLLGLLVLVVWLVVPQLVSTVQQLGQDMPRYLDNAQKTLQPYLEYLPQAEEWLQDLDIDWREWAGQLGQLLQSGAGNLFSSAIGVATSIVNGFVSFFVAIIFACYLLLDKEHLTAQLQGLLKAYLPEKRYTRLCQVGTLTAHTFSGFVSGQCLEALIVTLLFTLVLSVGGFSYSLLISVIIGVTSLVPMVGGFIGCLAGAFLLLVSSGFWRALAFVIVFLVVQQIEGNLIYPHVVGSRLGLPPVWTLVAVMVGGGLAGIFGMMLFIPLFSIGYTLLHQNAKARLAKKGIPSPVSELEQKPKTRRGRPARKRPGAGGAPSPTDAAEPAAPKENAADKSDLY